MTNVFLFKSKPEVRHLKFLSEHFGENKTNKLFEGTIDVSFFNFVSEDQADFILLPHNFFDVKEDQRYLKGLVECSGRLNKKILVFAYGDSHEIISLPNTIIFRTSQYRTALQKNEIIVPPLIYDLGQDLLFRSKKKSDVPTVGFVGWADFINFFQRIKYYLKISLNSLQSLLVPRRRAYKQGIFFRRKAIDVFKKSKTVKTNFILRTSYSAHKKTISISPERARREYVENILGSDVTLSPKGDGNYSARFFEVLSLGRIPLLVDTETVLPLENSINYADFIIRVDYRALNTIDQAVYDWYADMSNEVFTAKQKLAQDVYQKYLSPNNFMKYVFSHHPLCVKNK